MTSITIKEDVQLPKTEFETLAELRKAIAPRFTEAEIEKMSLKEYITSGAVDEDETFGPFSMDELIAKMKTW